MWSFLHDPPDVRRDEQAEDPAGGDDICFHRILILQLAFPYNPATSNSQITDHVTYLSVRPDPDRVLPAGYVYPLLLKNLPAPAQVPAAAPGGRGAAPA